MEPEPKRALKKKLIKDGYPESVSDEIVKWYSGEP